MFTSMPGRRAGHFRIWRMIPKSGYRLSDQDHAPQIDANRVAAMSHAISPLAPTQVPDMPEIAGVRIATGAAGIKYKDRTDVLLVLFGKGTTVAGVTTRSKCSSAPVEWCRA